MNPTRPPVVVTYAEIERLRILRLVSTTLAALRAVGLTENNR